MDKQINKKKEEEIFDLNKKTIRNSYFTLFILIGFGGFGVAFKTLKEHFNYNNLIIMILLGVTYILFFRLTIIVVHYLTLLEISIIKFLNSNKNNSILLPLFFSAFMLILVWGIIIVIILFNLY